MTILVVLLSFECVAPPAQIGKQALQWNSVVGCCGSWFCSATRVKCVGSSKARGCDTWLQPGTQPGTVPIQVPVHSQLLPSFATASLITRAPGDGAALIGMMAQDRVSTKGRRQASCSLTDATEGTTSCCYGSNSGGNSSGGSASPATTPHGLRFHWWCVLASAVLGCIVGAGGMVAWQWHRDTVSHSAWALRATMSSALALRSPPQQLNISRVHRYTASDPPPPPPLHQPDAVIIAIAAGVRSAPKLPLAEQPLMKVFVASLAASMAAVDSSRRHVFRLYLAYDEGDPLYDANGAATRDEAARAVAEAAAPAVMLTTHWVRCTDCTGKPSWAHDRAACAAFVEGADYVFRINDDTEMPSAPGWDATFVDDLAGRRPVPNLGVVGPDFYFKFVTPILSHDFTHWTHVAVHGFYYPPTLPNWSSDDWITYVYERYDAMHKLPGVRVSHATAEIRYIPSGIAVRQVALDAALEAGTAAIDAYTSSVYGIVLPHTNTNYTTP